MTAAEQTKLTVNGQVVTVSGDRDTPLLYVLRNDLGLKGTRFGCGDGLCGSCRVIVDGRPVVSCDVPLWSVAGKSVETIESVAAIDPPHALVSALIECQAGQCGYCLPGIVMSAKALIDTNPHPTRDEIIAAIDGNLCRCGAHVRIIAALEKACAEETAGAA